MRTLSTGAAVCAFAAALFGSGEHAGRRAPGFSLPDASNRQHDLQDYRGRVVLIDIMRTDCPHCVTFSHILEQAKARYGNRIEVLSVVHPPADTPAKVAQFIATNKIKTPVLFDCGQMAASYIRPDPANPAIQLPQLFIVGADGIIKNNFVYGPPTREIFEGKGLFAEIDKVLPRTSTQPRP